MKKAFITPWFKKKDNYISVNPLPIISKIIERIFYNQVFEHMSHYFHTHFSGFRNSQSCQDILIKMTEDWYAALDEGLQIGVISID